MQVLLQETPIRKSFIMDTIVQGINIFFWIDPILIIMSLRIRLFHSVRQDEVMVCTSMGVLTPTYPRSKQQNRL